MRYLIPCLLVAIVAAKPSPVSESIIQSVLADAQSCTSLVFNADHAPIVVEEEIEVTKQLQTKESSLQNNLFNESEVKKTEKGGKCKDKEDEDDDDDDDEDEDEDEDDDDDEKDDKGSKESK